MCLAGARPVFFFGFHLLRITAMYRVLHIPYMKTSHRLVCGSNTCENFEGEFWAEAKFIRKISLLLFIYSYTSLNGTN